MTNKEISPDSSLRHAENSETIQPAKKKGTALSRMIWMLKRIDYLMAFRQFGTAKTALMRANMEIAKLDRNSPLFIQRLHEFNTIMLELSKARYWGTVAIQSGSKIHWKQSRSSFKKSTQLGNQLLKLLEQGSHDKLPVPEIVLSHEGTEILYADGAPIVPEVCPVVILQGSSYQMGYQYAQQLIQIFGPWILERKTGKDFSADTLSILKKWEEQVEIHAPEILDMCRGWMQGANDAGIPMSYYDVVDIWTGHAPPKTSYMGRNDELTDAPPTFACAGAAAWGEATPNGKLVTGSSGDHDPSFPVVIMAYPDTGNNFMFTTFSAIGDIALVGSVHMFGHPGMNSKGVAYVEHGGQPRMIEPMKYWGYGLRRTTSVFHILRFANSAKEALEMELKAPIGDVGMDNNTIGGFFADSTYGYVLESRKEPVVIREAGHMGETDFLYANNSAMHREASKAGWMQSDQETNGDWEWDEHGGWHPLHVSGLKLTDLFRGGDNQARIALRGMYHGSFKRNLFHFHMLSRGLGTIDMEYMKMIFRLEREQPNLPWKQRVKKYNKTGDWADSTVGHAGNGVLTVTMPDDGPDGIYSVCIGQAKRGLPPNSPFFASFCPIYNETNTFWELKLADSPKEAAEYAAQKASEFLSQSKTHFDAFQADVAVSMYLSECLKDAETAYRHGDEILSSLDATDKEQSLYLIAKATRYFLKAQAKALQVYQFIVEPPEKPKEFGL